MKLQTPMFFSWRFRNRPFSDAIFFRAPPTKRLMGKWAPTKANRGPPASRFLWCFGLSDGVISSCKQTLLFFIYPCWKYRPPGRMMKIGSWGSIIPAAELQPVEDIPALRSLSWSLWKIVARCSGQTQNSSVHGKMTTFSEKNTFKTNLIYTIYIYMHIYISNQSKHIDKKPSKPRPGVNKLWPRKAFLGLGTRTPARVKSWSQRWDVRAANIQFKIYRSSNSKRTN